MAHAHREPSTHGLPRSGARCGLGDAVSDGWRARTHLEHISLPTSRLLRAVPAAEAVIAISSAKLAAQDPTPVYWSYRGDKMPRVSKALSQVFFDAYMGNGNIRYRPNSKNARCR